MRLGFLVFSTILILISSSAFAEEPARKLMISNMLVVRWEDKPVVILLARDIKSTSDVWTETIFLSGKARGDTWQFVVPAEHFATYNELILTMKDKVIVAVVTLIPEVRATVAVEPAREMPQIIGFSMGSPYYVNLDHVLTCEGEGCKKLIAP